jgi:hypothetical protein
MGTEEQYNQDKLWIQKTLDKNSDDVGKLFGKFEEFKIETTSAIAVIQTKLALYVMMGSSFVSVVVGVIFQFVSKH